MQKRADLLTYVCILFMILLFVSGIFDGAVSNLLYVVAFAVPIFLGLHFGDDRENGTDYLRISRKNIAFVLPTVIPLVAIIFLLSYLSSLLIFVTLGETSTVDIGDNILIAVFRHAIIPAFFEEALFRYLPLRMMGRSSPRTALILSSLYFAMAHHSFFSIPYAFVAGFAFMMLDLATDSVLPSLALHIFNNLISILWILYSDDAVFVTVFLIILVSLTLLSLLYVFIRRKEYGQRLAPVFFRGEEYKITATPLFLILPAILLAVAELV